MTFASRTWAATVLGISCLVGGSSAFSEPPPPSPKDGRAYLQTPDEGVGKYVGLLYFDDPRRDPKDRPSKPSRVRVGTAFLVSDRHIVTCAHCITNNHGHLKKTGDQPYPPSSDFNNDEYGVASKIYFAPGHYGTFQTPLDQPAAKEVQPYGIYRVIGVNQIYQGFFDTKYDNVTGKLDTNHISMHDLVVLELDKSTRTQVGGFFKLEPTNLDPNILQGNKPTELYVNGYDRELGAGSSLLDGNERLSLWQVTRKGTLEVTVRNIWLRRWYHLGVLTCKATGGASGGPIWLDDEGEPVAVGIVVEREGGTDAGMGLFFKKEHIDFIKEGLKPVP